MKSRFNIGVFPVKVHSKIDVTVDMFTPLSFGVSEVEVGLGLTPKMPSEEHKPLFNIVLSRHIIDRADNKKLAELSLEYNYRMDINDDFNPNEGELFEMLNDAGGKFAVEWAKLLHGTRFQHHGKTAMFSKDEWNPKLERTIDFWNDSIRHIQVDENGKPLDTD